jgi:hypothetical protein
MELKKPNIGVVYEDDTERQTWAVRRDTRMHQERRQDLRNAVQAVIYVALGIAICVDSTRPNESGNWGIVLYFIVQAIGVLMLMSGMGSVRKIGKKLNG